MIAASSTPRPLTGRHVALGVAGFFAVVIGLDALFVTWAVQTFPGEVSERAYEDGLAYNQTLAERRAQESLGWTAQVRQGAVPGQVTASFSDAEGATLAGLTVQAALTRPATDAGAATVALRAVQPGVYAGATPLQAGAWDLKLTARDGRGRTFEATRRLVWR